MGCPCLLVSYSHFSTDWAQYQGNPPCFQYTCARGRAKNYEQKGCTIRLHHANWGNHLEISLYASAKVFLFLSKSILVPRGRAPFGQHQESRPLARSNTGSPRFTDFPSLCACSESSPTNLIGSGLNLLCLQSHSKPECRWTWPEVEILSADQKERGLWGREWSESFCNFVIAVTTNTKTRN